jgi:hypothetical protein
MTTLPKTNTDARVLHIAFALTPDIESLLDGVGRSIASTIRLIDAASATSGAYDDDWFVDQGSTVDDALGVAFVICQLYLTAIASGCEFLHNYHARQSKNAKPNKLPNFLKAFMRKWGRKRTRGVPKIGALSGERSKLLQRGGRQIAKGPGYTAITIIEALANYFKHKDEWPNRWSDLQQIQRRSANVLRNIGLLDDKDGQIVLTGNFRDAFTQIFGDDDYTNVGRLTKLLDKWRDTLKREYQREFTRLKAST